MKNIALFGVFSLVALSSAEIFAAAPSAESESKARALVEQMLKEVGPMGELRKKNDVEYTYVYETPTGRDVSTERYRFDGELSWAKYTERSRTAPDLKGELIQGWDGRSAWSTVDGKPVSDEKLVGMANFLRKTNYYWFAMMQKLADPGIQYSYEGKRGHQGVSYDLVKIGFESGIGEVQDAYVLYINPETHLVDQFLFTVRAFGREDPLLMTVDYVEVEGLKLPANRKYTASDWNGNVPEDAKWTLEIMKEIRFNNGFDSKLFQAPKQGA